MLCNIYKTFKKFSYFRTVTHYRRQLKTNIPDLPHLQNKESKENKQLFILPSPKLKDLICSSPLYMKLSLNNVKLCPTTNEKICVGFFQIPHKFIKINLGRNNTNP